MPDPLKQKIDERSRVNEKIGSLKKYRDRLTAKIEAIKKRREQLDDKGYCLDGCSMPYGIRLMLLDARANGWDGIVNSADRTDKYCDSCSDKMSQRELWECYQRGQCAPANPPGTGSHEYVNGGNGGSPAYATKFPVGAKLPWWGLGIDVSLGDQLVTVLAKLGYKVHRAHGNEPWHINCSESPRDRLIARGRV